MIVLAIGLVSWTTIARLVRGQVLVAARRGVRARGAGARRERLAHRAGATCCRTCSGPVIVDGDFGVPTAIFAEAALSFIGLGLPLPTPSWGQLVDRLVRR